MKNYLVEYFIGLGLFISQEVRAEDPEGAIFRIFPVPAETYWKVSCRGYGYASVNYYRVAGGVLVADNDSISMWSGDVIYRPYSKVLAGSTAKTRVIGRLGVVRPAHTLTIDDTV
jgi:hypothetical protein